MLAEAAITAQAVAFCVIVGVVGLTAIIRRVHRDAETRRRVEAWRRRVAGIPEPSHVTVIPPGMFAGAYDWQHDRAGGLRDEPVVEEPAHHAAA